MTKMITEHLALEAIAQGQISWDDTVTVAKKTFREGEEGAVAMENWNLMLPGLVYGYAGMDGLKTGETSAQKIYRPGSKIARLRNRAS